MVNSIITSLLTLYLVLGHQAFGFSFSKADPIKELNEWLERQTSSTDLLTNIEAAEKAKASAPEGVEKLIALRYLAKNNKEENLQCDIGEIEALRGASSLLNKSKSNPYSESRSQRHLSQLIIGLQREYIPKCLARYQAKLQSVSVAYSATERTNLMALCSVLTETKEATSRHNKMENSLAGADYALWKLDRAVHLETNDLVGKGNLKRWHKLLLKLSDRNQLCDSFQKNVCIVNRSTIQSLIDDKIREPCKIIRQIDNNNGKVLNLIAELVEQNKLEPGMAQQDDLLFMFSVASGLKLCRTLEYANWNSLVDDLTKYAASKSK